MDLGTTIKKLRMRKGFNQKTFASSCNITPSYLSQVEGNLKEPNIAVLKTIAKKLGIPLPILFFLTLDSEDISKDKKHAFEMIGPSVKSLIQEFFLPEEDIKK